MQDKTTEREGMEEEGDFNDYLLLSAPYVCSSTGSLELAGVSERNPSAALDFEARYRKHEPAVPLRDRIKQLKRRKWEKCSAKSTLAKNFPTLSNMRQYKVREYLPNDAVAGLTAGITMIPQGMAFASLSTLPPIVGLYISLFASLAYFFLGTSHQLSWGCVAVLSILTGNIMDAYETKIKSAYGVFDGDQTTAVSTVAPLLNTSDLTGIGMMNTTSATSTSSAASPLLEALSVEKKIEVAGAVTLVSGIVLAVLGKLGLGRLTSFMSDTLITSFTVGVSFHVISSQIRAALDLKIPRQSGVFKLIRLWVVMLKNIQHANPAAVIVSLVCLVTLYTVKRFINEKYKSKLRVPVPIELFVVIAATIISTYAGLSDKYSVSVVKEIPVGVPKPRIPDLSLGKDYITEGLVIIFVSFTQNVAMAKLMGLKHNYRIDANQEMFACGMVSVVCSVFSGYISGPSVSRSLVQDGAGGKTQVASLFAAALVFLVIMLIGPYFYYLPTCTLAAIIIVNLRSMFLKIATVPDLWRKSPVDASVWIITCVATVVLETDLGLLVGIVVSILFVLVRSQVDTVDVLSDVCVGDDHVWRSVTRYSGGKNMQGVMVVRINSALYFANAEIMTNQVFKKTGFDPVKAKKCRRYDNVVKIDDSKRINGAHELGTSSKPDTEDDSVKLPQSLDNQLVNAKSGTDASGKSFQCLIVDLTSVPFIDIMGVQGLQFLIAKYQAADITVYFSGAQEKCVDTLKKTGFLDKHRDLVFITVEAAMKHALSVISV